MIKGVIFDYGNTLVYPSRSWEEIREQGFSDLTSFLIEQRVDLDPEVFKAKFMEERHRLSERAVQELIEWTVHEALRNTLTTLGYGGLDEQIEDRAVETFLTFELMCKRSYPDGVETLDRLKDQGYRLGMISNTIDDGSVQRGVDRFDYRARLEFVITSAAVGIRKPHPKIFQQALARWDFPPSQVVMVGDTLSADILGAQRAGMPSILVTMDQNPENVEYVGRIVPDAEVERLSDLPKVIAHL
ncbi:MAG: HAD family hydrolase [Candidatus Bipolaricaulia bacterium]